jgi:hypothetical protein
VVLEDLKGSTPMYIARNSQRCFLNNIKLLLKMDLIKRKSVENDKRKAIPVTGREGP